MKNNRKYFLFPIIYILLHAVRSISRVYLFNSMSSFSMNITEEALAMRNRVNSFVYYFDALLLSAITMWVIVAVVIIISKKIGCKDTFNLSLIAFGGSLLLSIVIGLVSGVTINFGTGYFNSIWNIADFMVDASPHLFSFPFVCGIRLLFASLIPVIVFRKNKE